MIRAVETIRKLSTGTLALARARAFSTLIPPCLISLAMTPNSWPMGPETLAATSSIAWLSEAYLLAGRLEDARQRAAQALDLARQYQQRGNQAWALWLLGESTARQASPEGEPAAGHYRQALALAEELGMRPLQAHCHRGLGMLYSKGGQREQARAELETAIALYRAMDMTFWLPQAQAALAQVEVQ